MSSNQEPDLKAPAYRVLANKITAHILAGDLRPGFRLPGESKLAQQHGVSRSTVREALRELSAQNLIKTKRGVTGGTFIAHPEPSQISTYLERAIGMLSGTETVSLDQLLDTREILEVPAARLAAQRRTVDDLKELTDCLADEAEIAEGHRFEGNRRFHKAILDASKNPLLAVVTEPVFGVLRTHILRDAAPASFWGQVTGDHREIVTAIRNGDAVAAGDVMRNHLEKLRTGYLKIYQTDPG